MSRCTFVIEGPNGGSKSRPRPWWRRNCLRIAVAGTDRCWQHQVAGRAAGGVE